MTKFAFSERLFDYIHTTKYTYDAYVVESGRFGFAHPLSKIFQTYSYQHRFFCQPRETILDDIISNMHESKSLVVMFDNSFFDNHSAKIAVCKGKQIRDRKKNFKLIVVELTPIPAKHLCYFELFIRIPIQTHNEDAAYQQLLTIITEPGNLFYSRLK